MADQDAINNSCPLLCNLRGMFFDTEMDRVKQVAYYTLWK